MDARIEDTARRVLAGDVRATARLMRWLDDGHNDGIATLKLLAPHTGKAWVVGITGSPGAGKSTLTDALIAAYRAQGKKVGVLAVDPTSPFSGGAILGDRIRMQRHETDSGVFIRSMATRGTLGGLSHSTRHCIQVLDAYGCDVILVETVGVGQDEVDIVQAADTSIVVTVPGMGDDIQAIKAGILEIADLFVINKSDREGTDRTEKELRIMLELVPHPAGSWRPTITRTVAVQGVGIAETIKAIADHRAYVEALPPGHAEARHSPSERAAQRAVDHMFHILRQRGEACLRSAEAQDVLARVRARELDPFSAGEALAALR